MSITCSQDMHLGSSWHLQIHRESRVEWRLAADAEVHDHLSMRQERMPAPTAVEVCPMVCPQWFTKFTKFTAMDQKFPTLPSFYGHHLICVDDLSKF